MIAHLIPAAAVAAGLSFLLVGLYLLLARKHGVIDHPGDRSSHSQPTPTGGGIGLVLALVVTGVIVGFVPTAPRFGGAAFAAGWSLVLAGVLPLALVGLWDDIRSVSAWLRLVMQFLAALGLLFLAPPENALLILPLGVLLVWSANAFNFMDGSNGMAGAQAAMSGALLAWVFSGAGQPGLALAAACVLAVALGFLPWNGRRARLFMGDAGSVPLGFAIAALCYLGVRAGALPWPAALTVLAVFWVDAGLTLFGRLWRGERWYTPHRKHVYQRLISRGWSHGQVLLLYMALNLFIVAPAVVAGTMRPEWALGGSILAFTVLSFFWGIVSLKLGEGP